MERGGDMQTREKPGYSWECSRHQEFFKNRRIVCRVARFYTLAFTTLARTHKLAA
jgi:hypothetical protein